MLCSTPGAIHISCSCCSCFYLGVGGGGVLFRQFDDVPTLYHWNVRLASHGLVRAKFRRSIMTVEFCSWYLQVCCELVLASSINHLITILPVSYLLSLRQHFGPRELSPSIPFPFPLVVATYTHNPLRTNLFIIRKTLLVLRTKSNRHTLQNSVLLKGKIL